LQTSEPLFQALALSVQSHFSPGLPRITANAIALRQALVITLTAVARSATGKTLQVIATAGSDEIRVEIQVAGQVTNALLEESENLAMAQQLVALSGGTLSAQGRGEGNNPSKQGEWSSVTLALPLALPATLLVIDDNQDALLLLQRFLTGTHYHPIVTRDPAQGLLLAQELAPCAILLDVMLPGMDGWEVLARLRRHPATQHIPVIICTILPEEALAFALGASAFLRKPLARDEMLETLQTALLSAERRR
jgi:CheY-like chemotaxis protein